MTNVTLKEPHEGYRYGTLTGTRYNNLYAVELSSGKVLYLNETEFEPA